jgi:hypothetical protein
MKDKQFMVYCEDHMGSRIISTTTLDHGRIISIVIQTGKLEEKTFIRVTGCYAYPDGNMTYVSNGKTRNDLRKRLFKLVTTLLEKPPKNLPKGAKFEGDIFAGDLQETITRTARDNQGSYNRKQLEYGMLKACAHMISMVRNYNALISYITRESLSSSIGGRGISHIMGTESIEEIYMGGCVDPIVSACSINTDHHIVAADFNFSFKSRIPSASVKEERYHWNRISKILVDMENPISSNQQEAPSITFRESTARTSQYLQNQDLFEDLQAITGEGSELENLIAIPFLEEMIQIRTVLVHESKKLSKEEQEGGILIARS